MENHKKISRRQMIDVHIFCPHAALPPQQQKALEDFKSSVINEFDNFQADIDPHILLAYLIQFAARGNVAWGGYHFPPKLAEDRDPQAIMALGLKTVADLNTDAYGSLSTPQKSLIEGYLKTVLQALSLCADIVKETIILALLAEYAANVNQQTYDSPQPGPIGDSKVSLARALASVAMLNRQSHVGELPDPSASRKWMEFAVSTSPSKEHSKENSPK